MDRQKTIKSPVSISGVGLHTGENVNITILPANENHGYKFQRTDIEGEPIITALADFVVATDRGTTLEQNGARVHTTEHLLAAIYGLEIDNILIQLDGPEVPIMDGSAQPFMEAILEAGTVEQDAEKEYFVIKDNLTYEDTERGIEMLAVPQDEFRVTVMVDYNSPLLGTQHASLYNMREFKDDFSPCRTFVFLREVEALYRKGLIKGGDVDNAIVMVDTVLSDEKLAELKELFNKPNLQVEGLGMLNNVKLKYENEPARHKLVDIIGDMALVGVPIKGHILAARPGHTGNVAFARLFREQIKKERKAAPRFDLNAPPVYDIMQITNMLPHRYPFLLVDKIIDVGEDYVVGVKNVTMNEHFFQGHFPGAPVMPGVLIVEAMAQTGGMLVLGQVPDPENYLTYFMKMDNVKFKQKVLPGDTLVFKLQLITPIRRGICHMQAHAYVGDKIVAEGELMAQVVKEKKNDEATAGVHTS